MYDFEKGLYYRVSTFFGFVYFILGVIAWKFLPFIYSLSPQEQNNYRALFDGLSLITGIIFLVFPFVSFILLLNEKIRKNKAQYNLNKSNYIWRIICLDLFIISQIIFLFQLIAFISLIILTLIYAPALILILILPLIFIIFNLLPIAIFIIIIIVVAKLTTKGKVKQQSDNPVDESSYEPTSQTSYDSSYEKSCEPSYETSSSIPIMERKESKIMIIVPSLIIIFLLFHFMCTQFVDFLEQYNFIQKNQNQKYKGYFEPEYRIIYDFGYQYIVQKYKNKKI